MAKPRRLPKTLEPEERERFLQTFNTRYPTPHRNLCMVRLMMDAGLRSGEVVALRPDHINMLSGRLMVREGKGKKDRTLWLQPELIELIGRWLERRPRSPWLFPTREGKQLNTRYLRMMVKRHAKKAGVQEWEKVTPHCLRHTFASDLLRETGNLRLVQAALGHSDLRTTSIYLHVSNSELEQAMKALRKP